MISGTLSGKQPPTGFLVSLWSLAAFFVLLALAAGIFAWRWRRSGLELDETQRQGRSAQAGCLFIGSIPAGLLGLGFLYWAISVT